jgi:hypothetical protein
MPYTLTMSSFWLVLVAIAGIVVGYLFRGRTAAVPTDPATAHHPAAHDTRTAGGVGVHTTLRPTDADELGRLRERVERLDTQLSITIAERDHLRRVLEASRVDDGAAPRDASERGDTEPTGAAAVE